MSATITFDAKELLDKLPINENKRHNLIGMAKNAVERQRTWMNERPREGANDQFFGTVGQSKLENIKSHLMEITQFLNALDNIETENPVITMEVDFLSKSDIDEIYILLRRMFEDYGKAL